MSRIRHQKVLSVLEKRALQYQYGGQRQGSRWGDEREDGELDETGTLSTQVLTDDGSEAEEAARRSRSQKRCLAHY